jgi:hypothetical protein
MDGGEIYLVTCIETKLQYVGATQKWSSEKNIPWGIEQRWKCHISDAAIEQKYNRNCSLLHQDINKYGLESFIVEKIIDCDLKEMDELEQKYIAEYNTIHPNGYNMSIGGKKTTFCELARQNMSEGQLGKRYTHEIDRKNAEDKELPKYISSIRRNNELLGYQVKKFPIGTDKKEYIYKTFKNKANPTAALQKAIEHLEQLKIQYAEKLEVKEDEKESKSKATAMNLPKFVYPTDDEKYFVKGLKDYGKVDIPRFDFESVDTAVAFIQEVAKYNDAKKLPFRWSLIMLSEDEKKSKVLEFIEKTTYAGIHNGYAVKFVEKYDEKDKPVKIVKTFVGPSPMEEKLAQATTYIQDIAISMSI